MARKRMIDPDFWRDEKVSKLSYECRLLFIGIWNFADDEGIFKGHPALLSSEVFPYDNISAQKMSAMLGKLSEQNLIYLYNNKGQDYGIVLNFKKHQTISHPQPSSEPMPSIQNNKYRYAIFERDGYVCAYCKRQLSLNDNNKYTRPTIDHVVPQSKGGSNLPHNLITACEHCNKSKGDIGADEFHERSMNVTGTLHPNIIQDNIIQDNISKDNISKDNISCRDSSSESDSDNLEPEKPKRKKTGTLTAKQQAGFDRFWAAYPKKESPGAAEKAWAKIDPDEEETNRIIGAVLLAKNRDYRFKSRQFTPLPATWLNAKGYASEYGDAGQAEAVQVESYRVEGM